MNITPQLRRSRTLALATLLLASAGCAGPGPIQLDANQLPGRFEIELRAIQTDQRQVYYVLDAGGTLSFGGGRDAGMHHAQPVGLITDDQRLDLWRIIVSHNLFDAQGSFFAKHERAGYDVRLRADSIQHHFNTVDDLVPGLDQLDHAMFEMQADMRYRDVSRDLQFKKPR